MASPPTPPGSILSARSNRWPIRSSLVRRYLMLFGLGATCDGTRSTMRSPNLRSRRRGVRGRRHAGPKRSLESSQVLAGPRGSSRILSGPRGSSRVLSAHPASPENFFGLFDMRRMSRMPRSARICAPVPYSRESAGKPSCKFASSVSTPCSCSAYACLRPGGTRTCLIEEMSRLPPVCLPSASRLPPVCLPSPSRLLSHIFAPRPMPRPSCPRRYSKTPQPSSSIACSAFSSCGPQSQRRDPNTSPVQHSECTRTSGAVAPAGCDEKGRRSVGAMPAPPPELPTVRKTGRFLTRAMCSWPTHSEPREGGLASPRTAAAVLLRRRRATGTCAR